MQMATCRRVGWSLCLSFGGGFSSLTVAHVRLAQGRGPFEALHAVMRLGLGERCCLCNPGRSCLGNELLLLPAHWAPFSLMGKLIWFASWSLMKEEKPSLRPRLFTFQTDKWADPVFIAISL